MGKKKAGSKMPVKLWELVYVFWKEMKIGYWFKRMQSRKEFTAEGFKISTQINILLL